MKHMTHGLFIDGEQVPAIAGERFAAVDPSTGERTSWVALAQADDVDRAVRAARRSFDDGRWRKLSGDTRGMILWKVGDLIEQRLTELVTIEVIDNGMPLALAKATILAAAQQFRYYAGWCTKALGSVANVSSPLANFHAFSAMEPIGVAALIVPWNVPFNFAAGKVAAALAGGCSCVLKPSEETSLSALELGKIIFEAGVPDGVVNIVAGAAATGQALVEHPFVDKIAFTGSTSVGRGIATAAATAMKRVTLEMGGKSPVIVFDDARVEDAIAGIARGIFTNAGQMCVAGSRVYIQDGIYEAVVSGLVDQANHCKLGNGLAPSTEMGPLISARQRDRVASMVARSRDADGLEILCGGLPADGAGFFFQPTIVAGANSHAELAREEVFGPVLLVTRFSEAQEALDQANDSDYGLSAAIWTRNLDRAHLLAQRLNAGTVWVNTQLTLDMALPFGGYKLSGLGQEKGIEGLRAYMRPKSVFVRIEEEGL